MFPAFGCFAGERKCSHRLYVEVGIGVVVVGWHDAAQFALHLDVGAGTAEGSPTVRMAEHAPQFDAGFHVADVEALAEGVRNRGAVSNEPIGGVADVGFLIVVEDNPDMRIGRRSRNRPAVLVDEPDRAFKKLERSGVPLPADDAHGAISGEVLEIAEFRRPFVEEVDRGGDARPIRR